jgi:hypothetical protein
MALMGQTCCAPPTLADRDMRTVPHQRASRCAGWLLAISAACVSSTSLSSPENPKGPTTMSGCVAPCAHTLSTGTVSATHEADARCLARRSVSPGPPWQATAASERRTGSTRRATPWQSVDGQARERWVCWPCPADVRIAPLSSCSHDFTRGDRWTQRATRSLEVQHLSALLRVVHAPGAESARALAMLFWAQRVRTGTGPERDVTPWATLHGPAERAGSPAEAYGVWRTSSGVSRPEPRGGRHGASPSPVGGGSPLLPCATPLRYKFRATCCPRWPTWLRSPWGAPWPRGSTPCGGAGGVPGEPADPSILSCG